MDKLTENNIKRVTLTFLKNYYRYRPRKGQIDLQLNMRAKGGVIVDGYLAYKQDEKSNFTATVEATSVLTRNEVKYRLNKELLTWDALALGALLTTIAFGIGYARELFAFHKMSEVFLWVLLSLAMIAAFAGLFSLIIYKLRRYRHIYAIEQFKRYYADEQWVAIGENVFPGPDDPFFLELREQCIYNGFGLIIVDQYLRPSVHITPSREDVFSNDRKVPEFFSLDEITRQIQAGGAGRALQNAAGFAAMKTEKPSGLKHSFFHQKLIFAVTSLVIVAIIWKEAAEGPVNYVNEEAYQEQMIDAGQTKEPESTAYLVDTSAVRPFQSGTTPYPTGKNGGPDQQTGPKTARPGLIVYQSRGKFFEYDCERLYDGVPPRFVIAVEIFDSETPLKALIQQFNQKGLSAMGLWLGCFSYQEDDFVLFLDQLYATREEAVSDINAWQRRIEREGLSAELEVLSLQDRF